MFLCVFSLFIVVIFMNIIISRNARLSSYLRGWEQGRNKKGECITRDTIV